MDDNIVAGVFVHHKVVSTYLGLVVYVYEGESSKYCAISWYINERFPKYYSTERLANLIPAEPATIALAALTAQCRAMFDTQIHVRDIYHAEHPCVYNYNRDNYSLTDISENYIGTHFDAEVSK